VVHMANSFQRGMQTLRNGGQFAADSHGEMMLPRWGKRCAP
jgi:hypothetical protein